MYVPERPYRERSLYQYVTGQCDLSLNLSSVIVHMRQYNSLHENQASINWMKCRHGLNLVNVVCDTLLLGQIITQIH